MKKLRVLDLFSGIGGFSLGLERTGGFETVAFCEIEPYARAVLAKHWPEVPCFNDVRTLTRDVLDARGIGVDVICGGFPCQDISSAGHGVGIEGERSGLWSEIARLVRELRPAFVIVENVSALLSRGLDKVLGDLAACGYDAEWDCIPASAVGAPHRRDRIWIVAYPGGEQHEGRGDAFRRAIAAGLHQAALADAAWFQQGWSEQRAERERVREGGQSLDLGHADIAPSDAHPEASPPWRTVSQSGWWFAEPAVGRVAHGVPARVDRLKALGNAVVPQIPELIGRAILASMAEAKEAA